MTDQTSRVQRMEPAPRLPSVLDAPGESLSAPPAPEQMRDVANRLAVAHQEYLDRSVGLHREFVTIWQATSDAWASALGRATAPRPAPVVGAPMAGDNEMRLDRPALETLASGKISTVFGELFARQDGHAHQMRPAKPPLLLVDRITRIEAVPGSLARGTLWSETNLADASWYLDDAGRVASGALVEMGQAHIILISYLGADWQHDGDRRYRMTRTEVTIDGELPRAGDRCVYRIDVEGHTKLGDADLFQVRYTFAVDGQVRGSVRLHGGLFAPAQLTSPNVVAWTAESDPRTLEAPFDPPERCTSRRTFSQEDVTAFATGRPADCFGPEFAGANAHVRTPKIPSGRLKQIDEVEVFDPHGGPWRRGYLRATTALSPDAWFFAAHFHDDPCMPGFVMLEGGLQAMIFYLAAMGFTLERDGWRFEPVRTSYTTIFKRQVTPDARRLTYELFVESITAAPEPTIVGDILLHADGRAVCHIQRARLRLLPDTPLEYWQRLGPPKVQETAQAVPLAELGALAGHVDPPGVSRAGNLTLGYASLLCGAWGRPSLAMGPALARFDGHRRMPRLPGPPFLFLSRVVRLAATMGRLEPGASVEIEYDVPERVWYFDQNGAPVMPFAVLLEAMLQTCGWLSVYLTAPLEIFSDRSLFRNLDGVGVFHQDVSPATGTLRTCARLRSASPLANTTLVAFDVETFTGGTLVAAVRTDFGFFPREAFEDQVGLPTPPAARERVAAAGSLVTDLKARSTASAAGRLRLAGPMLLMVDRITAFDPAGGAAGLGYLRGEKDVDPSEWFFKAHFYQDPVQPGSLGIESLYQLLQFYMVERGLGDEIRNARFETPLRDRPMTWKYRGQVVPGSRRIVTELVVTEIGRTARGPFAAADGSLWVDGMRVYSVSDLAVGIVEAPVDRGIP